MSLVTGKNLAMSNSPAIPLSMAKRLLQTPLFAQPSSLTYCPDNLEALPESALQWLLDFADLVHARSVFEFGSGRSTSVFLKHGLKVSCLEDSSHWLDQTISCIPANHLCMLTTHCARLRLKWFHGSPIRGWENRDFETQIHSADIILIDSPNFTPFRERVLVQTLAKVTVPVIIDDISVPTISRFCDRIRVLNPGILHARVPIGHGFDVFWNVDGHPLAYKRTVFEVLRAWRRFAIFYKKQC